MHLVYIDEVKYDEVQEPYYWLCALAVSEEDIVSVEDALNRIAADYFGSPALEAHTEFHATDIVQGKRAFKGHDLEKRVILFKRLVDVIDGHPNLGRILVRLDPSRMNRNDHQSIAFMFLVERIEQLMIARASKALLIADHDKQFINTNVRSLSTYKATGTEFQYGHEILSVVDTVHHTQSHHSRLLQLSDVYAYSLSLRAKQPEKYPKNHLVEHVCALSNFVFPSKYKYWPPK